MVSHKTLFLIHQDNTPKVLNPSKLLSYRAKHEAAVFVG